MRKCWAVQISFFKDIKTVPHHSFIHFSQNFNEIVCTQIQISMQVFGAKSTPITWRLLCYFCYFSYFSYFGFFSYFSYCTMRIFMNISQVIFKLLLKKYFRLTSAPLLRCWFNFVCSEIFSLIH